MKHVGNDEEKPSMRQRWNEARLKKMTVFWLCLASVVVALIIGFTWGGWMTGGAAQKAADAMARDAVIDRLAPICVAQFNQDPDSITKLDELNGMTSSQRAKFVQDQGWATITGMEKPDRKVADACTKLLLEMSQ